ncbi:MAG TPA: ferritin-like domain-containing protein [Polyangiaceae bacterium]
MRRSLADVSVLTGVIAAAIAASACGNGGRLSGGDAGILDGGAGGTDAVSPADASSSEASAPENDGAVIGDCGIVLTSVEEAGLPVGLEPDADIQCQDFNYQPNAACCGAQLVKAYVCTYFGDASTTCSFNASDPCVADMNEAADACAGWCNAVAPSNALGGPYSCFLEPWNGSGPITGSCYVNGSGCNNGRPPRSFRPRRTRTSSRTAEGLSMAAQLEAASVCAFQVLARDLERFGAPRSLIASARSSARDETRHARAMTRAAKRYGCTPPRVRAKARSAASLPALAKQNAEEGCVRETFSAAVAVIQARTARDPALRVAMRRIADDELRHAAFSWRLHEWLLSRLPATERHRLAVVRRRALDAIDAELAGAPSANPDLGIPGPVALRALLREMRAHLS